ncbi:hypothetical protein OROHE_012460 [Orobanche hederae]
MGDVGRIEGFLSDFDPCHGSGDLNHRRCGGDVRQCGLVIKDGLGTSILETSNAGQKLVWKSDG